MGSMFLYNNKLEQSTTKTAVNISQTQCKRSLFTQVRIRSSINKNKKEGVKMINEYCVVETIGEGLFGKVKKVFRKSQSGKREYFAMKVFSKDLMDKRKIFYKDEQGKMATKNGFEYFLRELDVYSKIRYKCLTKLHEVLVNDENDKIYLILELAQKGQLIDWDDGTEKWKFLDSKRKRLLKEPELRRLMRDIVKAVYVLHQNNIIHRDIKPQNILFNSDNDLKLTDFGISLLSQDLKVAQITGTQFFLAPESFQTKKSKVINGKPLDIWALGVTMYSFQFLKLPFYSPNYDQTIELIQSAEPKMQGVTKELQQLLSSMLQKDPSKRVTAQELIQHPWIDVGCDPLKKELNLEKVKINDHKLLISKANVKRVKKQQASYSSDSQEESASQKPSSMVGSSASGSSQTSKMSNLKQSRSKIIKVQPPKPLSQTCKHPQPPTVEGYI